jgi:glutathione S-transferase
MYELVIGNKAWSSWSLRPWLVLTAAGIPFRETLVALRQPETKAEILRHSPSGKVPLLKDGDLLIWDSLAIIEYIAEQHPQAPVWPVDKRARAMARSVAAEMHAGFYAARNQMPMDLSAVHNLDAIGEELAADIRRLVQIWRQCRETHGAGGPYLFGAFSAADAMYAPVATRFRTYGVNLSDCGDDGTAAAYRDAILAHPGMKAWEDGARRAEG